MNRILMTCLDAVLASVVLIPLFLILNKRVYHSNTRTASYLLFAVYLSAVFSVVGLPHVNYVRFDPNYNFEPFAYMFSDYENSLLNVVLFMPLGFFLPVLWKKFRKLHQTMLFGFGTSLLIETLQIFTLRATDVNDLMTNSLGTILGWSLGRMLLKIVPSIVPGWKTRDAYVIFGIAFAVIFFVYPFLSDFVFSFFL